MLLKYHGYSVTANKLEESIVDNKVQIFNANATILRRKNDLASEFIYHSNTLLYQHIPQRTNHTRGNDRQRYTNLQKIRYSQIALMEIVHN